MVQIQYLSDSCEFAEQIEKLIQGSHPFLKSNDQEGVMERVVEEFVGTKNTRLGPRPNLESLVLIRNVVRRCIAAERSIPVLIASAAVKVPVGNSRIDLAELSALRMLADLQDRVRRHYAPGLLIRLRLEDGVELMISQDVPNLRASIEQYVSDFRALCRIMGYSDFIEQIRETEIVPEEQFVGEARMIQPHILHYLSDTDGCEPGHQDHSSWQTMHQLGWEGEISLEMRKYFRDRYRRNYPNLPESEHNLLMSRYLACVLTRKRLNAAGASSDWPGRLEISFVPRLPYAPTISPRVYYRSIPRNQSEQHIAYWCAKGIVRVGENSIRLGLLNWWSDKKLTQGEIVLKRNGEELRLQADYTLDD